MEQLLGVDIGGTNVKFGIVSKNGELLKKIKHPTAEVVAHTGQFIDGFIDRIKTLLKEYPNISKIGIGLPGLLSKDRTTTHELQNIPSLNDTNLSKVLSKAFPKIEFKIENDANAAVLGEYHFSKTKLPESFGMITLGTGIGGGAVIDGQLFLGGGGNGMEIGHMVRTSSKTFEDLMGKRGIVGGAENLLAKDNSPSLLRNLEVITAKEVEKAAKKGDKIALKVYSKLGTYLGEQIVSLVRVLDVDTIILGGGVASTFKFFEKKMLKSIEEFLPSSIASKLSILPASLANEAGIIGAASLCMTDK
jgi:glucokinase